MCKPDNFLQHKLSRAFLLLSLTSAENATRQTFSAFIQLTGSIIKVTLNGNKVSDFSKFHLKTSKCWTLVCCVTIESSEEAWISKIASNVYIHGKAKVVTLVHINSETKNH